MASINLELNSKADADGRHGILIRLTLERKKARINSGKKVKKKDFNTAKKYGKWIRSSAPNYDLLNLQLKKQVDEIEAFTSQYLLEKPYVTVKELVEAYQESKRPQSDDWLKFFDREIQKYKDHGKTRFAIRIEVVRNKWAEFLDGKALPLQETSLAHISDFESFLKTNKKNAPNTVAGNIKVIKQIYRTAAKHGLIEKPNTQVLSYAVKTTIVQRDKLTETEIATLEQLELPKGTQVWHARNCFLFAFYCAGMRFSDLAMLCWDNFSDDRSRLTYIMSKTGKGQTLKVPTKAKDILNLYSTKSDYVFQLVPKDFNDLEPDRRIRHLNSANTLINRYLKEVTSKARIKKRISMHTARHSFAYIGFKKTKDPVAIQSMLKHNKLKETQDYIISLANEEERDILGEIFE